MQPWPELPLADWNDTLETLHRWTEIVGKIRMELTPLVNHWWNVTLYVTARGLTTSLIPCGTGRWFDMEFDFIASVLRIRLNDGAQEEIALAPRSVADFHAEVVAALQKLDIRCAIWTMPVEISNPIRFERDTEHHSYDAAAVRRFWTIIGRTHVVFEQFRSSFIGKCSPVHFFWGSFDLAVTRFSGRPAPARPDVDALTAEAYSHEVSSVGWWPGDERLPQPSFYSYAAPEPAGFRSARVLPEAAYYNEQLGGFYLHYDDVRRAASPEQTLLDFCQSTYEAAANCGNWDRAALERKE
jgi:hypothetical protein